MLKIGGSRYYRLSALSGCAWAVVAYVISAEAWGPLIWGGLAASPVIGLLVGVIYRPAYGLKGRGQALASLLSLYLAVTLFGLAVGIHDLLWRSHLPRLSAETVLQAVLAGLWGVTFTGYFLPLWLLAIYNHRLLRSRSAFTLR